MRVTTPVPTFASHYYLPDRKPFLNLSDLDGIQLESVMGELDDLRGVGLRRVFGRRYMELRRLTESRLYDLFVAGGGLPSRRVPHYFILGECAWFRDLHPQIRVVTVDLADLPAEVTSFTYPDSFTSMGYGGTSDSITNGVHTTGGSSTSRNSQV